MTTETELKDCPFCGGKAELEHGIQSWNAICRGSGAGEWVKAALPLPAEVGGLTFEKKSEINAEFTHLYELSTINGKHGFYESAFAAMHLAYAPFVRSLSSRLETVTRERDSYRDLIDLQKGNTVTQFDRAEAAESRIKVLEAALRPFAAHASVWPNIEDNMTVVCKFHVQPAYEAVLGSQDFRDAAAALKDSPNV